MTNLIVALFVLFVLAPVLIARGGEMRQRVRRSEIGAVALVGVIRLGVRVEWRVAW